MDAKLKLWSTMNKACTCWHWNNADPCQKCAHVIVALASTECIRCANSLVADYLCQ